MFTVSLLLVICS